MAVLRLILPLHNLTDQSTLNMFLLSEIFITKQPSRKVVSFVSNSTSSFISQPLPPFLGYHKNQER
jgi:hypothetical protein